MTPEIYATYNYYDMRGRRLAVFCRFVSATEAEIYTLTCSLEDQFVKSYARKIYENYLTTGKSTLPDNPDKEAKPTIELVTVEPEKGEIQTLVKYCDANYGKRVTLRDLYRIMNLLLPHQNGAES